MRAGTECPPPSSNRITPQTGTGVQTGFTPPRRFGLTREPGERYRQLAMDHAHSSPSFPPRRITLRGLVLKFVLIWLIYTLSIGPMYWTWFGSAYVTGDPYWVLALYSPLRLTCYYVPVYGDLVETYIWWWNFPASSEFAEPLQQFVGK